MILPLTLLLLLIAGTAIVALLQMLERRRQRRRLMSLARDWRMHYAARDRFDLAARVAERLPVAGSADVRIIDLIYGMHGGVRRYVFSVHYTLGVVRRKRRLRCVACLSESGGRENAIWSSLQIAPATLPLMDQYRKLGKEQPEAGNPMTHAPSF